VEKALPGAIAQWIVDARMRPEKGGIVVALVGGDGCGKTTCTRELESWLSAGFATMRGTLGNPPRSLLTFAVGGALRLEQRLYGLLGWDFPRTSTLELFRYACAARDCHRLYQKVQRFAAAGGIAICERYPVSELPTHVGPCIPRLLPATPSRLSRLLRTVEGGYYQRMVRPDLLLVLRLDPELAVIRKPDEPAEYVRTRNRHVWETEWQDGKAEVMDASQPLDDVLDRLKARVWQAL
jgi:thymidylate kinase